MEFAFQTLTWQLQQWSWQEYKQMWDQARLDGLQMKDIGIYLSSENWLNRSSVVFQSGKTVLANFLSDTVETVGGEYCPTQGVR